METVLSRETQGDLTLSVLADAAPNPLEGLEGVRVVLFGHGLYNPSPELQDFDDVERYRESVRGMTVLVGIRPGRELVLLGSEGCVTGAGAVIFDGELNGDVDALKVAAALILEEYSNFINAHGGAYRIEDADGEVMEEEGGFPRESEALQAGREALAQLAG